MICEHTKQGQINRFLFFDNNFAPEERKKTDRPGVEPGSPGSAKGHSNHSTMKLQMNLRTTGSRQKNNTSSISNKNNPGKFAF